MSRYLIIASILLLVLFLGVFLIWPKYQNLRMIQAEIQTKKVELQYKEEYLSNLNKLSEELKKYEKELAKINSALPSQSSTPALFDFLQKTASQNGLILKKTSAPTLTAKEGTKVKETSLSLSLSGSYASLKNFLSSLEKSARIIETESVSFSAPKEGEIFEIDLQLKTHSY